MSFLRLNKEGITNSCNLKHFSINEVKKKNKKTYNTVFSNVGYVEYGT